MRAMLAYFGSLLARTVILAVAAAIALLLVLRFAATSGLWTDPDACYRPDPGMESWSRVDCPTTKPTPGWQTLEPLVLPYQAPIVAPYVYPSFAPYVYPSFAPYVYPSFAPLASWAPIAAPPWPPYVAPDDQPYVAPDWTLPPPLFPPVTNPSLAPVATLKPLPTWAPLVPPQWPPTPEPLY